MFSGTVTAPGVTATVQDEEWPERVVTHTEVHTLRYFIPPFFRGEARLLGSGSGRRIPLSPTLYFAPGLDIEGLSRGGRVRALRCGVTDERFRQIAGETFEWRGDEIERAMRLESSPIVPLMMKMAGEVRNPGFGSETYVETLSTMIILELIRYLRSDTPDLYCAGRLTRGQLQRVRERVEASDQPSPTVTELATLSNVGERHFTRLFKNATGRTISECVREAQAVRARQLLEETELPLKEIAFRLGFAGHSSFTAAFKRATGESPKGFRKRTHGAAWT